MTSISRQLAAIGAAMLALATPASSQVQDYREIKTPPLRKFAPVQPKRIALPNGMIIFLQEDHELPLIRGTARIRGGGRDVPASKAGLVSIYAGAWRTGGTTARTGDDLDDFLESRAARVETTGSEDSTSVRIDVLKDDFNAVFPIFVDLLKSPAFRQEKIELARTQVNTGISRRNDEPEGILNRELVKLGYGATSSYARQSEYATVASITRDDLLAFHKRFVHPNNMIVGFVGDFDSARMEKTLRDAFASWPRGSQAPPPPTDIQAARPGIYFVPKDDVNQSNIAFVHSGTLRNIPDFHAIRVLNEIVGADFSGRLMNRIRTQMGLAYAIGGGLGAEWDHPGLFRIQTSTKSGSTWQTIDAVKKEISALVTQPFTADELSLAKESILNAYVFTMDSKEKVLAQRMGLEFYGFPADYYQRYPSLIESVSADDVARVARKYVTPDNISILVVGNEKEFDKPLTTLGPVTPIDITIPQPGSETKPSAPATGSDEGKALIRKVAEYVGGQPRINAVQAVHIVSAVSRQTPQGMMDIEIDAVTRYPDDHRVTMKMAMGEMTMVATKDAAFAILPGGGVQDLPGSQREAIRTDTRQDLMMILKNIDNPAYTFAMAGTEKIAGVEAQVLEVTIAGSSIKLIIDPVTGRVLRKVTRAQPQAQGEQITEYTEWKDFSGIKLPATFTLTANGAPAGSGQLKTLEINPAVDPKMFQKP